MNMTTKRILASALALFIVTGVSVALLSLANALLKHTPELDEATAQKLAEVCPPLDAANPVDSYEMLSFEALRIDLSAFYAANAEGEGSALYRPGAGSGDTLVLAAYRVKKGEYAGAVIVQAQAKGYVGDVVMLTAFDAGLTLIKTRAFSQNESFWRRVTTDVLDRYTGMPAQSCVRTDGGADRITGTGATVTMTAIHNAVRLSARMAVEIQAMGGQA